MKSFQTKYYSILVLCSLLFTFIVPPMQASDASLVSQIPVTLQTPVDYQSARLLQGNLSDVIQSDSDILAYFAANDNRSSSRSIHNVSELRIMKKDTDAFGKQHYLLQQHYQGLPVYGQYIRAHVGMDQKIYAITNDTSDELNSINVDTLPVTDGGQAVANVLTEIEATIGQSITLGGQFGARQLDAPKTELMIYPENNVYHLAYRIDLEYVTPEFGRWTGFVDAHTGVVLKKFSRVEQGSVSGSGTGYLGTTRNLNVFYDDDYYLIDASKPMYRVDNGVMKGTIETYDWANYIWGTDFILDTYLWLC